MVFELDTALEQTVQVKEDPDQLAALTAAYALNMCTVSVSQIVDYADPVILDQEYDAILNNLNIQNMPKKEPALLEVLERILDVIIFFRISERERALVDKEYQFKMKNAVWNAVPNFGLIVAGGLSPAALAISIASQVGIGYMNYRKAKAEHSMEYERETWRLERTAIEQLNALRRQLFDTAWKMSDTYDYQDEYRLTERQIAEYNQILMDNNAIRKYERLDVIKKNFLAYPPFWYHFGHTANDIAQQYGPSSRTPDEQLHQEYRERAKFLFSVYDLLNYHDLLRDDPITCACALEHIDLLDLSNENDKQEAVRLLQIAEKYCGGECDVLQLCVFAHLRIGNQDAAISLLRRLINSDYNTNFNAQILSRIYVNNQIREKNDAFRNDYILLSERMTDCRYLFPWPDHHESEEEQEKAYNAIMFSILVEKYFLCLRSFFEKYARKFNALLPVWQGQVRSMDPAAGEISYEIYDITEEAHRQRIKQAERAFQRVETAEQYRSQLRESYFWFAYEDLFDEIFLKVSTLNCIIDKEALENALRKGINRHQSTFKSCYSKLQEYAPASKEKVFGLDDYKMLADLSFFSFTEDFISQVYWQIANYLRSIASPNCETSLLDAEQDLRHFCGSVEIDEPDIQIMGAHREIPLPQRRFSNALLGDSAKEMEERFNRKASMLAEIKNSRDKIIRDNSAKKVQLLLAGSISFDSYIGKHSLTKQINWSRAQSNGRDILAVLDDRTSENIDLVFTTEGIVPVVKGKVREFVYYSSITSTSEATINISGLRKRSPSEYLGMGAAVAFLLGPVPGLTATAADIAVNAIKGDKYSGKWIDTEELVALIRRLSDLSGIGTNTSHENMVGATQVFDKVWNKYQNLLSPAGTDNLMAPVGTDPDAGFILDYSDSDVDGIAAAALYYYFIQYDPKIEKDLPFTRFVLSTEAAELAMRFSQIDKFTFTFGEVRKWLEPVSNQSLLALTDMVAKLMELGEGSNSRKHSAKMRFDKYISIRGIRNTSDLQ